MGGRWRGWDWADNPQLCYLKCQPRLHSIEFPDHSRMGGWMPAVASEQERRCLAATVRFKLSQAWWHMPVYSLKPRQKDYFEF